MAKREIVLATIYGKKTVEAEATYGAFAIHKADWGGGYVVTHIPTGLAVTFGAPSIQSGLRLARMLMRPDVRWTFTDKKRMSKRTNATGKAVLDRWNQQRSLTR